MEELGELVLRRQGYYIAVYITMMRSVIVGIELAIAVTVMQSVITAKEAMESSYELLGYRLFTCELVTVI